MAKRKVEDVWMEIVGTNKAHVRNESGRITSRPLHIADAASLIRHIRGESRNA